MVTEATAEFLDCFREQIDGYVGEFTARCFKNADPRKGNPTARSVIVFEDSTAWQPLINATSAAEQGRACWSQLAREVWPTRKGQRCLIILTTDTKKRLWIRARIGALGTRTPVLVYDSKLMVNEVRLLDWPKFLECLNIVEQAYSAGFSKDSINSSLYGQTKAMAAIGLPATMRMERALAQWRGRLEFAPALLIAQKEGIS